MTNVQTYNNKNKRSDSFAQPTTRRSLKKPPSIAWFSHLSVFSFQLSTSLCSVVLYSKRGFGLVRSLLFSLQSYIPNFSLISKFLNLMSPFMVLYLISFNFPFSVFNFQSLQLFFDDYFLFFHYNY